MKVAIVGTGVSGLVCAWGLYRDHDVHVFEADDRPGGHTHTHDVHVDGRHVAVDSGFIVFNERTYPGFVALLDRLGVRSHPTDMGFSVSVEKTGLEYGSTGLGMLFAQRRNLLRPAFHRMIRDVLRFHREAPRLIEHPDEKATLGEYLAGHDYSREFVEEHLVPMAAAIWSAEPPRILDFPALTFVRFYQNHGLLSRTDNPVWRYVEGGSRSYVERAIAPFRERVRLATPVIGVRRRSGHVEVHTARHGRERFDQVIFATHSDQALALLEDPEEAERGVLSAIRYQPNEAVLHTDASLLPRNRRAWTCWNVRIPRSPADRVQVTYHMNQLQKIPGPTQFCVTLNRTEEIDPERVIARIPYAHPIFDARALAAQALHDRVSGLHRTHYCGAYWGNGFHEDGVQSALRVLRRFGKGDVLGPVARP
jgi:predicted NAD/FAD-binding protein